MLASLLVTFREGLEAALIVGILLTYLDKIGEREHFRYVIGGVIAAIVASGISALLFNMVAGGFSGRTEEIFEGVVMLFAAGVLSYMVVWMHRESAGVRGKLQEKVDISLSTGKLWGLASLAFVSVFREGIETVLFLVALAGKSPLGASTLGGTIGILGAILLAWIFFKGGRRIDLRLFFRGTGILLIIIAAGLVAHGIHELEEAKLIPSVIDHVWDINGILNEKGILGSFLNALFGYNGNPSLVEVIAYFLYLSVIILWLRWGRYFLTPHTKTHNQ